MGIRLLSRMEVEDFVKLFHSSPEGAHLKDQFISKLMDNIENDFTIFGASAVEDMLQDNLNQTIDTIKSAGIKIWVITGDKAQTALNIAISSHLFDKEEKVE